MADIDQIIASGGKTNANFDGIADIAKSYWEGKDQRFKNDERELFKSGVPKNADGTINYSAMRDSLFQHGNIASGTALDNLDVQRQSLRLGQEVSNRLGEIENGGAAPGKPSIVSPPSSNRTAATTVAPPLNRGGAEASASGKGPVSTGENSIVGIVGNGVPDEIAGPIIQQVSAMTKLDPNAPINDPAMMRRVTQVAQAAIARARGGQPQAPQAQPQVQPQAAPAPAPQAEPNFNDRFGAANSRGLAPTTIDPNIQQRAAQYTAIVSNPALPQSVRDAAKMRLDALQKNSELTGTQKEYEQAVRQGFKGTMVDWQDRSDNNKAQIDIAKMKLEALYKKSELTGTQKEYEQAVSQGFKGTIEDWQDRSDNNKAQTDILTKSILPKLDKSQETANAAKDEINAIHRSREQLDAPGGVFSGAGADIRLKLAKVANFLGVPGADKIENTEAFGAAIGGRVLSLVKGLGAGTGISNADRDFARDMAGGNVKLNEGSIRRILDIGEQAARFKITSHNDSAGKMIKSTPALKDYGDVYRVEAPGSYKKPAAPAGSQKFGSPADVHAAVASGALKKGDTFLDLNDVRRRVP